MKKLYILSLLICCTLSVLRSQDAPPVASDDSIKISKNLIKFNITSALIKNYSLQYERVLSRGVSATVTFRMMPVSGIPYTNNLIKWFDITDPDALDIIENVNIGNFTITPEIRFYTGKKGYGTGFYFALFYRYGRYTFDNAFLPYDTEAGNEIKFNTSGNVSSHTGGFMIGAQWAIGRHMCIDWWILGSHFGVNSGDILGLPSAPLSIEDQQNIKDDLNDIDIPMLDQTVNVTSNKVSMIFDGPWVGIRAGLSVGVRF